MAYIQKNYLIKNLLFPPRCPGCETIVSEPGRVCDVCREKLPYIKGARCLCCSQPVNDEITEYCNDCKKVRHQFIAGCAVWDYDDMMAHSIANYKYHDKKEYALFYANEMIRLHGDWIRKTETEALLPVPIHKRKKRERGYNQAQILAELIGNKMGIPVYTNALLRKRYTNPQKGFSRMERVKNLEDAFEVREECLNGVRKITLIDDIYTTGATMDACASVLKDAGIQEVYFLSVCIGNNI